MKRLFSIMLLIIIFGVVAFSGDLDKPSTRQGNIITGSEISDLYSMVLGDSTFDNIKMNGVQRYTALLTQTSTSAPVVVELENTLDDTVTVTRSAVGTYYLTSDSAFTADKYVLWIGGTNGDIAAVSEAISITWVSRDSIAIKTADVVGTSLADALMTKTPVQILIYP